LKKLTLFSRAIEGVGEFRHIHYGDIHTKLPSVIENATILPTITEKKDFQVIEQGDILVADASEDYKDLGKAVCYIGDDTNVIAGLHTHLLRSNKNIVDPEYLINLFQTNRYQKYVWKMGTGVSVLGLSKSNLGKYEVHLPTLNEQKKVANFFNKLNKKSNFNNKKIELLQEQKKGFLQKMFPKADEAQPEMRFAGFTGDWEERALKEVGDFVRTSIDPQAAPDSEFIEYSMPSYDNGRLPEHVLGKSMQSMRLKISGEVLLINKLNVRQKRIWLIEDAPDNAVASNEFRPFTSEKIDMTFLEQLMLSDKTTRDLESISSGTSNSQKRITPPDVLKYQIKLPKERDEQEKIGIFFKQLDNIIVLHQQKIDIYKERKKGFMQQMFI
jgi:type I restriction enzyme S subunit